MNSLLKIDWLSFKFKTYIVVIFNCRDIKMLGTEYIFVRKKKKK